MAHRVLRGTSRLWQPQARSSQREALVLHYWQGQTVGEIARHMDRGPAAVAGLIKRGLKQLRTLMNPGD